jgi:hypothetical protein
MSEKDRECREFLLNILTTGGLFYAALWLLAQ